MKLTKILSVLMGIIVISASCGRPEGGPIRGRFVDIEERLKSLEADKPELSAAMNTIQIHHTKLYLAIEQNNTDLASYLIHELEEDFEHVVENHPNHDGVDVAGIADNTVFPAIEDLEDKMVKGDAAEITLSFDNLTVSCNKCHHATGHPFIKITNPLGRNLPESRLFELS